MVDQNKWNIPGWGAAQAQITEAIHFLCEGKTPPEREQIAQEVAELARSIARGEKPSLETTPFERDRHEREAWARRTADRVVTAAMLATERYPQDDRDALLCEIAKIALWHLPDAPDLAREIGRYLQLETLKQPHPRDTPPGRD